MDKIELDDKTKASVQEFIETIRKIMIHNMKLVYMSDKYRFMWNVSLPKKATKLIDDSIGKLTNELANTLKQQK